MALAAMLSTATHEEAARKLGITSRTLRNYLKDPEFSARYEEANKSLVHNATSQIQRCLAPAIAALREIAEDESAGLNARVNAAKGLLEYGIRLSEIGDIYKRLEKLEETMEEST